MSGANAALAEHMELLYGVGYELYLIVPRLGELSDKLKGFTKEVFEVYYYGWAINPNQKISFKKQIKYFLRKKFAILQIRKVLKRINPDYCATNTITIDVGALAAKKQRIKHVWFVHEFGDRDHGFNFKSGITKARQRILDMSHVVAVNSKAVYNAFPQSSKLRLLYYNIPIKRIIVKEPLPVDQISFLLLGQIAPAKNQIEAIEAISNARKRGYNFQLSIYGNIVRAQYYQQLQEIIIREGVEDLVHIHEYNNHIEKLFQDNHALIMCSRNEAFGRVTLESLLYGVPVIGAASGGTLELISDGKNGYLYEAGNPEDLSEKMISLYKNMRQFDADEISTSARLIFNESNTKNQLKEIFS